MDDPSWTANIQNAASMANGIWTSNRGAAYLVGDLLEILPEFEVASVDLVFGSPPYMGQRKYLEAGRDLGIARDLPRWVSWMLDVTQECLRVASNAVVWVVGNCVKAGEYQPAAECLVADWHRRGGSLAQSHVYLRPGLPGSGGKTEFRRDHEMILLFKHAGPLRYCDATAIGAPPKWLPGGAMSNRGYDDQRANRPGGNMSPRDSSAGGRRQMRYIPPKIANPGTIAKRRYASDDVIAMLEYLDGCGDTSWHTVGGGQMGSKSAHDGEAPMPLTLAERYVRTLCPAGGIVLDPFAGTGTTLDAALRHGRKAIGIDLRPSQLTIARKRLAAIPAAASKEQPL